MLSRRHFIKRLGAGTGGILVFAACTTGSSDTSLLITTSSTEPPADSTTTTTSPSTTTSSPTTTERPVATTSPPDTTVPPGALAWERVNLGNVSAYVLARNGEAAIVDTGLPGAADSIESSLAVLGLTWNEVGHVIATHLHSDHIGSMFEVMERASGATGYAGAADIPAIDTPRPFVAVDDGANVFDLTVIATPGHTPGHISVLDPAAGVLVAGDAIVGSPLAGPVERFSSDIALANASVSNLAAFDYEVILFGHGEPVLEGGSDAVAALATDL
jgi:glyoxylase-like metal-dependent hydrolase (beta-lactamase superfamily II)